MSIILANKPTINDFFDYGKKSESITMFGSQKQPVTSNKIYITNYYGKKIVQLIINEESNESDGKCLKL